MLDRYQKREAYRATREFWMVAHDVTKALRESRPASADRLGSASCAMIHFIIHSDGHLKRRRGQWRLARALAAAASARIALQRMHRVVEHRVIVGAALEVLERATNAINAELLT